MTAIIRESAPQRDAVPRVVDCLDCGAPGVPVVWVAGAYRVAFHVRRTALGVVRSIIGAACVGAWKVVLAP
jgi:hypothetical protein